MRRMRVRRSMVRMQRPEAAPRPIDQTAPDQRNPPSIRSVPMIISNIRCAACTTPEHCRIKRAVFTLADDILNIVTVATKIRSVTGVNIIDRGVIGK